ncbi:uncharacterized protein LY89DRAFT_739663 [Mollisia scopiformis]|uniref:Uncharacterized protein n=1 Tax=Mollisia scopiformis TaxID=149040 RepID=A0A194WRN8_MOLSC|nr:uncharacterized protein LY89DRAFT_739663 [Mollisia scopiformis]KUJ10663.1 hypothetical protein LY89DRAFT_739663 [Mollisia scopiformis]
MAPTRPSDIDNFFARYQNPILGTTFATQVLHYQYIRRTQPAIDSGVATAVRSTSFPRPLRAGLGWAVVFIGLLTKITLAKKSIRDFSDPILAAKTERKQWKQVSKEEL